MTITTTHNRMAYVGNGSTTIFPYTFLLVAATDLLVYHDNALQASGYTVSGVGLGSGGNVTYTTAPAAGVSIVFQRQTDTTQQVNLIEGDKLPAESVEGMFDKVYAVLQDQLARLYPADLGVGLRTIDVLVKRASQTVTNSSTFQSDTELVWAVAAEEYLRFDLRLRYQGAVAAGLKVQFAKTGGVSAVRWGPTGGTFLNTAGVLSAWHVEFSEASASPGFSTDPPEFILILNLTGIISGGATPGTVTLQWAQETADPSALTIWEGSVLTLYRLRL